MQNASSRVMAIDDAQKTGAMMLFGEKYGDVVRVIDIGSSIELCGGTHVKRTGDIGLFKIVAESGVAAGVRRVEAVTGEGALALVQQQEEQLQQVADAVKSQPQEAAARIAQILDNVKSLEKELAALKSKLASAQGDELLAQAQDMNGVKVLAAKLDGADAAVLRETHGQAEGQAEIRCDSAGRGERRQGEPDRRRDGRCDSQGESGRTGEFCRAAGWRQRRRQAGHGASRRHATRASGEGAGICSCLGKTQTLIEKQSEIPVYSLFWLGCQIAYC